MLLGLQLSHLCSRPLRLLSLLLRHSLRRHAILASEVEECLGRLLWSVPSLFLLAVLPPLVCCLLLVDEREVVARDGCVGLLPRHQGCDLLGMLGCAVVPRCVESPLVVGLLSLLFHLRLQCVRVQSYQSTLGLQYPLSSVLQSSPASFDLTPLTLQRISGRTHLEGRRHGGRARKQRWKCKGGEVGKWSDESQKETGTPQAV